MFRKYSSIPIIKILMLVKNQTVYVAYSVDSIFDLILKVKSKQIYI